MRLKEAAVEEPAKLAKAMVLTSSHTFGIRSAKSERSPLSGTTNEARLTRTIEFASRQRVDVPSIRAE